MINYYNKSKEQVVGENFHLASFISKVEEEYGLHKLTQARTYLLVVEYICFMFNGITKKELSQLVRKEYFAVCKDIKHAVAHRESEDSRFMRIYWPLLQIYIDSTTDLVKRESKVIYS